MVQKGKRGKGEEGSGKGREEGRGVREGHDDRGGEKSEDCLEEGRRTGERARRAREEGHIEQRQREQRRRCDEALERTQGQRTRLRNGRSAASRRNMRSVGVSGQTLRLRGRMQRRSDGTEGPSTWRRGSFRIRSEVCGRRSLRNRRREREIERQRGGEGEREAADEERGLLWGKKDSEEEGTLNGESWGSGEGVALVEKRQQSMRESCG